MGLLDGTPNPEPINPVLSEIQNLSPQAHQALLQAHQAMNGGPAVHASEATMGTPSAATPAPTPMLAPHMQSQVPQIGASPAPHVEAPRGTIPGEENNVARMTNEGSGISQIHNPLVRGIATTADTIGKIVAPRIEQAIPGTEGHNRLLINQGNNEVKTLLGQNQTAAQTGLETANTGRVNEETAEAPQRAEDTHDLTQSTIDKNEKDKATTLQQLHANAVNKAIQEGRDPSEDPTVQHLAKAITGLQKPAAEKTDTPEQQYIDDYKVKHPGTGVADAVKAYASDTQKPMRINVGTETAALDRESTRFAKPHEKSISDAQTQLEKIADARSMINGSAEAQALGIPKVLTALVSGAGSGVRITQPELNAIAKARGITGDAEGFINSISGKGKLTDTQKQQLTGLLDAVKERITQKAAIASQALDQINGGASREEIIKADKDARDKLSNLETGGGAAKEGDTKVNSHGDRVVFKGGKWGPA